MDLNYENQTCTMSFDELTQLLPNSNKLSIVNCNNTNCTTTWVDGKELCKLFPSLAYNNVKDRKWRKKNQFPCYQDGPKARVVYNTEQVETWIEQNYKVNYQAKC
jgi:hypothetical protein